MSIEDWEERHREAKESGPDAVVVESASRLVPGKALDVACGTGRNAVWLAAQGWDVTGVDGSRVAIEILRERGVAGIVADLEKGEFAIEPGAWDLIVMCRYLQRDLFAGVREGLRMGGVAVVMTLVGDSGRYRMRPGELASYFPGAMHSRERDGLAEVVWEKTLRL